MRGSADTCHESHLKLSEDFKLNIFIFGVTRTGLLPLKKPAQPIKASVPFGPTSLGKETGLSLTSAQDHSCYHTSAARSA